MYLMTSGFFLSLSQWYGSSICWPWKSKEWGFVGAVGGFGSPSRAANGTRNSRNTNDAQGFMGFSVVEWWYRPDSGCLLLILFRRSGFFEYVGIELAVLIDDRFRELAEPFLLHRGLL